MNEDLVAKRIYIGAPIEYDSERKLLASTVQRLEEQHIPFIALANVEIGGRQVDCIVATPLGVSVVEVKSSYLPVRGDVNGNWGRLHQSGQWRPYTNAYQQALAAKNAVRSAMTNIKPIGSFYPDGHVVFTSGLAENSQLTKGDFKVTVGELDQFLSNLNIERPTPWSLNDWQVFATKLGLRPVSVDEAIASREDQKATDLLNQYNEAVAVEHGKDAGHWLPENEEQRDYLVAAAANGAGCFVTGASGCGKTLMAKWVAVHQANAGNPTFFFAAKDFTGSWANAVRREVSLLCDQSPSALWSAISRADKPVFLVLDGINELGSNGPSALRGIRALATRLGAKLIVTGQSEKPSDFEGLHTVVVTPPSIDLKGRIAKSGGGVLTPRTLDLLKVVNSGIEAEIAGRMGQELNADGSRVALLDQYIRMRLGRHARPGSFGLRRFASWLHQRVAFSASETAFDELMMAQQVSFEDCDALFAGGLLVRRGGRVSFAHEMIQNACASFDLAQQAGVDPSTFGLQLSTPFFEAIAGDVVSAIENTATCRAVLQAVTNPSLLCAAADGLLGRIAASVAGVLLDETVSVCTGEIRSLRLALIKENGAVRVEWGKESKRRWTEAERAQLVAIGRRAVSIAGLDVYLALCAEMDKRLASERQRLAEAAREAKFP
jgi:Nuclease-related domain/NACHT domain